MKVFGLLFVFLVFSASVSAGRNVSTAACEQRTSTAFPGYVLALSSESCQVSSGPLKSYSQARGDYDGDGKADVALLLRPKSGQGQHAISVCLSSKPSALPDFIADAYTDGSLSTTPKGREYSDLNTGLDGRYELDGVGSYICECCGATYILRKGKFIEIIDSD